MTPLHSDAWLTVYQGDCLEVMASMEPESVHCVVTSPPYWGLRDYGTTGQLGLEPTPEEYVANLVDVFRAVRRVLRSDGTVWLVLGDSYAGGGTTGRNDADTIRAVDAASGRRPNALTYGDNDRGGRTPRPPSGLAQKQLVGIPWRVAFALQSDGWYLRSDIIWAKPNPMPESVTDRPTKSHEYVFMLSKSAKYFWDADAVREGFDTPLHSPGNGHPETWQERRGASVGKGMSGHLAEPDRTWGNVAGRNLRSVWTIATQPYPGAHFATFPRKLVEPCIKAGSSERGVCPECGAPERVVRVTAPDGRSVEKPASQRFAEVDGAPLQGDNRIDIGVRAAWGGGTVLERAEAGWSPSCAHDADPIPATVLDPFAGSGTTGLVAQSLSRRAILIDLNADYLIQAMGRNRDIPLGLVG